MPAFWSAIISLGAVLLLTPLVRYAAISADVMDRPSLPRKTHRAPTPLLGGLAIFGALLVAVLAAVHFGWLPGLHIKEKYLVGTLIAATIIIIGGALDDALDLKPGFQIIWPIAASLVVIASGIGVDVVTNPAGGYIHLDKYVFTVLWWQGIPYKVTLVADLFTLVWLLGMSYTTKFLDGLDGLVSGVTAIGALVLAAVSLMKEVSQPDTAVLALILAGACLGFLVFNTHPAKIFLGEGGSIICGFLLGVLAIISGGKIATALLALGLPIFDTAFVIVRRLWLRRPVTAGDRSHLHYRLLDAGFTQRQTVMIYYFFAALFGVSTLILRGWQKVAALGLLFSILVFGVAIAVRLAGKHKRSPS